MEEELKIINSKLDIIIELLKTQINSSKKMDDHIVFIEHTYDKLRAPLDFVKDKFNTIMGKPGSDPLPRLGNGNIDE